MNLEKHLSIPKLLTLVVPTYNMEQYIGRCLESVTDKNIPDSLEVIVVNDGSKDNSLQIMRSFLQARPDIIRIIDKENGHYGSCINAGLEVARGKYFRMLDADDWMDTEALIALLEKLETCETDLVVTLRVEEYIEDTFSPKKSKRFPFRNISYGKVYDAKSFDIQSNTLGREFNMHSMTYKTDVLREVRLRHIEGICYTDMQYCFLPIDRIKDFVVYDLYLYHYVIGREGQSTDTVVISRNLIHISKVLCFMFDYLDSGNPVNATVRRNQLYFVSEAVGIFLGSLRMQRNIAKEEYILLERILKGIKKYRLRDRLLSKYYFYLWKMVSYRHTLNLSLFLNSSLHYRRFKKV